MAGMGMSVMHDAAHHAFSKHHMLNDRIADSIYLLGGFPFNWKYQHNTLHHTYTNVTGKDEDIDPGSILRLSPHEPLLKAHKFQHIYAWFLYALMTVSWVTDKDFTQLKRYKDSGVKATGRFSYTGLFFILILAKLIYYGIFIAVPVLFFPVAWYWSIVMFFAMHLVGGFILTVVFQTAHVVPTSEYPLPDKDGMMEHNWAVHQLMTTSDFAPKNKVLSWYVGGLNYQVEHHLFPNICHVHYGKISKFVKETAEKYGHPYHAESNFIKAVIQHGRMLKRLSRLS
jgi:linoleoyl-CoA desaturase